MRGSISTIRVKVTYLSLQITTHIVALFTDNHKPLHGGAGKGPSVTKKRYLLALQCQFTSKQKHWASLINHIICFSEHLVLSAVSFRTRSCQISRKPKQTIGIMLVQIADEMTQSEVHIIQNPWATTEEHTSHCYINFSDQPAIFFFFFLFIIIVDSVTYQTVGYRLQRIFSPLCIVKAPLR